MSYILDALRKADAERERGTVPGIHAQPTFGGAPSAASARTARPWVWMVGSAAIVLAVALVAWFMFGRGTTAPASAAAPPVAVLPVVPAPIPIAPAIALPPVAAVPTPAPRAAETTAPKSSPPVVRAASKAESRPAIAPAASAASSGGRVYAQSELPDDIRRQLPAVNVGGSMYSAKKADRLLIINGQVLHEGDAIAPGLMLEQIRLKAAVLAFKGYRYAIAF